MESIRQFTMAVCEELHSAASQLDDAQLDAMFRQLLTHRDKQIFVCGAGRCQYMLRAFCMRLMHLGFTAYMVGDTVTPRMNSGDLCIIADGAGLPATVAQVARLAKEHGAEVIFLTMVPDSPIGQYADRVVFIPGRTTAGKGYGHSIQPGGAKFEQCLLIILDSFIAALVDELGMDKDSPFALHSNLE